MSDLLNSIKPSENIIKHCLRGPSTILNVYFCILLARAILQAQVPGDKHSQVISSKIPICVKLKNMTYFFCGDGLHIIFDS